MLLEVHEVDQGEFHVHHKPHFSNSPGYCFVHKIILIRFASYLDYFDSSDSPDYLTVHKITWIP
jgi:hypothetical protein